MKRLLVHMLLCIGDKRFLVCKLGAMFLAAFWYTAALADYNIPMVESITAVYNEHETRVPLRDSVEDVAYKLSGVFGIPTDQLQLVDSASHDVIPVNGKMLKNYLGSDHNARLVVQKVDAGIQEVIVKNRSNQSFEFFVDRFTTMHELQREIEKRFRIPLGAQRVFLHGSHQELGHGMSLQDQISHESVLYVQG